MSKTSSELVRHALNGLTMGSRWSALFFTEGGFDSAPVRLALQAAVDEVDTQMSSWKSDSDLTRLNEAPGGTGCRSRHGFSKSCASGSRSGVPPAGRSTSAWAMPSPLGASVPE